MSSSESPSGTSIASSTDSAPTIKAPEITGDHSGDDPCPVAPLPSGPLAEPRSAPPPAAVPEPLPMDAEDLTRLLEFRHDVPTRVLGPHPDGAWMTVRALLPHAVTASVRSRDGKERQQPMHRRDDGLFEAVMAVDASSSFTYDLIVGFDDGTLATVADPYAFPVAPISDVHIRKFAEGTHARLFELLGARPSARDGVRGVEFTLWAPHAARVSVVGSFNRWDGRCHPMVRLPAGGFWRLFIPAAKEGDYYKYEIRTADGAIVIRSDPFAFLREGPPGLAAIVGDPDWGYPWLDTPWLAERRHVASDRPFAVARIDHGNDGPMGFTGLYEELAPIARAGYSHLELGAGAADCWHRSGVFAPGDSHAVCDELKEFVDTCHAHRLAVAMPALEPRLPQPSSAFTWFDGTRLFERADTAEGGGDDGAAYFDLQRGEVRSLFLSHALFWIERYHADALRVTSETREVMATLAIVEPDAWRGLHMIVDLAPPVVPAGGEAAATIEPAAARLAKAMHDDPFAVLGPHPGSEGSVILRALLPNAEQVYLILGDRTDVAYGLTRTQPAGLWETVLPAGAAGESNPPLSGAAYRYHVKEAALPPRVLADPYAFCDFMVGALDQHLFNSGNHYRIYDRLGSHARSVDGIAGVGFAVWAPNAAGVSVVGPFNAWDGRSHQMKRHGVSGIWELFIPGLAEGSLYKFEIRAGNGHVYLKADPYAFLTEVPPASASIVYDPQHRYRWEDGAWMAARGRTDAWSLPIAIYEVHLGSWAREAQNRHLSYRALADRLVAYVSEMGFTHVELLPVAEHPFEPSWGYQVTNYYAPSARFGRPEELMYLVDRCHCAGIGVILDWVPGHFPKDAFALAWFDGSHLYEHSDPRQGEHRDWGTLIFNYGRHEVENFLIANALFWLEHYHFDGLRVDAVASMLYLDYSRPAGDWIPNRYGGRENLEAIEFLKHTNAIVHERFPGAMMIAEESTSWPRVSRPTDQGGLGFGFKWNMGWMHDTLAYFATPTGERRHHHHKLTFGIVYAFDENFVLSLSHDEVVHLKGSLWAKMAGMNDAEKFANLRLLYLFMYAHPGKKLLFMGGEFAQKGEWNHARSLDWALLGETAHRQTKAFVTALNTLYRSEQALFEADFHVSGFEWLEADNAEECIIAFQRRAADPRNALLFVFNFSNVSRPEHRFGVPYPVAYEVVFDSNEARYGGRDTKGRVGSFVHSERIWAHGRPASVSLPLPALSGVVLKPAPLELGDAFVSRRGES
ncbi:MAG: 1,4-alpha-glucan branching protein GlgB [Rhodospirillales bacterium]